MPRVKAIFGKLDPISGRKRQPGNIRWRGVLNIRQPWYVAELPVRRQYRAAHGVAKRGDAHDAPRHIGCSDQCALPVDDRIGIAETFRVDEFDSFDVIQVAPGKKMRRTGKQRAIPGHDQGFLVLGHSGVALVRLRRNCRSEQRP